MASTLLHLQETENRYIYINPFTVTQNKVPAALENATKKKWVVRKDIVEHLAASGTEKINNGDIGTGTVEVITAAIYSHGGVNNFGEKIEVEDSPGITRRGSEYCGSRSGGKGGSVISSFNT